MVNEWVDEWRDASLPLYGPTADPSSARDLSEFQKKWIVFVPLERINGLTLQNKIGGIPLYGCTLDGCSARDLRHETAPRTSSKRY